MTRLVLSWGSDVRRDDLQRVRVGVRVRVRVRVRGESGDVGRDDLQWIGVRVRPMVLMPPHHWGCWTSLVSVLGLESGFAR